MILSVQNIDCVKFLTSPFAPMFDLIIADPPFNIGQEYIGYDDRKTDLQYTDFTRSWIVACWNRLNLGAAFVLHGSVECSRLMIKILYDLNLAECIEQEICWGYNFGQHTYQKFIETHCRAIVLRKPGGMRIWNLQNVLTPSKRLLMGDKRVLTAEHKGMVPFGTIWGVNVNDDQIVTEPIESQPNWGRVQGNNHERRHGHPNQLPKKYVSRLISAYSFEGNLVFDPFGGSGTTICCCKELNRSCITTDLSEWNCESIKQRLEITVCQK